MRPENQKMKDFLQGHGIDCTPKYLKDGSLKGRWMLQAKGKNWSQELQDKLNSLGFRDFDNAPLHRFSGNGGMFCVCVRAPMPYRFLSTDN